MGLFDKLKSLVSDDKKDTGTIEIVAPLSGEIVNIEDVPDVVFAEKIVGDGIAIKPTGNKMVAPVDGTIGKIFETNHAFSIESDSGIELFVHFGIDTVELKGEGFKRIAEEGQRVKVGDPVIEFDLPLLEEKAKSTLTPVVISNMDEIKELIKLSGSVTVGETPVIRIKKKFLPHRKMAPSGAIFVYAGRISSSYPFDCVYSITSVTRSPAMRIASATVFPSTIPLTSSEQNRSPVPFRSVSTRGCALTVTPSFVTSATWMLCGSSATGALVIATHFRVSESNPCAAAMALSGVRHGLPLNTSSS